MKVETAVSRRPRSATTSPAFSSSRPRIAASASPASLASAAPKPCSSATLSSVRAVFTSTMTSSTGAKRSASRVTWPTLVVFSIRVRLKSGSAWLSPSTVSPQPAAPSMSPNSASASASLGSEASTITASSSPATRSCASSSGIGAAADGSRPRWAWKKAKSCWLEGSVVISRSLDDSMTSDRRVSRSGMSGPASFSGRATSCVRGSAPWSRPILMIIGSPARSTIAGMNTGTSSRSPSANSSPASCRPNDHLS